MKSFKEILLTEIRKQQEASKKPVRSSAIARTVSLYPKPLQREAMSDRK